MAESSIKGVLIDLSGVVYVGPDPLRGALKAIERLRMAGLPLRFITNTTRTDKTHILSRLSKMGLHIDENELFTPAQAARTYLHDRQLTAHLLVHPNLVSELADLGSEDNREAGRAVLIGDAGEAFTYGSLNAAYRELESGATLLALASNRNFRDKDGILSLDAGAFVKGLEFGAHTEAVVLGKPSKEFFHMAVASMDVAPHEVVMIGDDAEADCEGAKIAGLGAILVRTGKYKPGQENELKSRPDCVVDDLSAAVDWILIRAAA